MYRSETKRIIYPSDTHEDFIKKAKAFTEKNEITLLLKGSLARGTASFYSDIDIILLSDDNKQINDFIEYCGTPIMINYTQIPFGIVIAIYQSGLCVDIDIRKSIAKDDVAESIFLTKAEPIRLAEKYERNTDYCNEYLIGKPDWYKYLRLFHRSMSKKLCHKDEEALNLLIEIKDGIHKFIFDDIRWDDEYILDLEHAYQLINGKYEVDGKINELYANMIQTIKT